MLVHQPRPRSYLFIALDATPDLCRALLQGLTEEEADFTADLTRFTIREVVAHLADWDTIFLARLRLTVNEETPILKEIDEGQRALDFGYAHTDVEKQLTLFREHRTQLTDFVRSLSDKQWERVCFHPELGHLSVEALATLVALHDTYHLHQITQWRNVFAISQNILD